MDEQNNNNLKDKLNQFQQKIQDGLQGKLKLGKDKTLNTITMSLGVLGAVCIVYVIISNLNKIREKSVYGNLDCVKATTNYTVDDDNMASLFSKGDAVSVLDNFYLCNDVKRNDLVLFRFSEQIPPVVRAVKGVPGDHYKLDQDSTEKKKWSISINGELVKSAGKPFFIESNSVPPLKTYEISRQGVLLSDEYIILSTKPPGLSDSTNLGLIHKNALVGRVKQK